VSAPTFSFPPESDFAIWLVGEGLTGNSLSDLIRGCGERLIALGIPVLRVYVAMPW
jgi:hypothetical protein